jgi:hypothetical protein
MQIIRKNLYKQTDVFKCVHDVHLHFKAQMSPYYILMEKKCYPHGCVYFRWKCKLLAKQHKCFRNFSKVGKQCSNCRYFYEEKIHQYPEFVEQKIKSDEFLENFYEFNEWVQHLKKERVVCEGTVHEVKADFVLKKDGNQYRLFLRGYLVSFQEGYIDNQFFEDKFYLTISSRTQKQLLFRQDDVIEFKAGLRIDRGRFKFFKSGSFYFQQRGMPEAIPKQDPLAQLNYSIYIDQPAQCLNCRHGLLVDIETQDPGPRRTVICLQGIADYKNCPIRILENLHDHTDRCANTTWNEVQCQHLL